MIEITGDDIRILNDENLRALIGLLCEAEARKYAIPRTSVTWGGHHNARDGGVDVRVAAEQPSVAADFIPRPHTGFQVKKPDMPTWAIAAEMRPNGVLRAAIADLAARRGAYIIVSADGSTTESALQARRDAMCAAVADDPNGGELFVDFYDRGRIATWVREHGGSGIRAPPRRACGDASQTASTRDSRRTVWRRKARCSRHSGDEQLSPPSDGERS
jgi:hypothetical protein